VTKLKKYYGLGNDKNKIASFSSKMPLTKWWRHNLCLNMVKNLAKLA